MRRSRQRLLSPWLRFRISVGARAPVNARIVGARAPVNARIGQLAEGDATTLKRADAAVWNTFGTEAVQHLSAYELLRREVPERRSLERYKHRTHCRH